MTRSALDLLCELVAIRSESGGESAIAAHLEGVFSGLGWEPRRSGRNVYAVLGSGAPTLLLNSHTDTVPAGEEWTRPAFSAVREGGRVYGRGANDAKGPLCAMILAAAQAYSQDAPKGRVIVAATCEEEISGAGLSALLSELPRPDAAVVGEPTGLAPAVAQKGLLILSINEKGRGAHAAWGGGENAVLKAARSVQALSEIRFDKVHPLLGRPSLEVTQIEGGTRHNVIPDRCRLTVDVRTTPAYEPEEIVEMVRAKVSGEIEVRSKRLKAMDTDPAHPIVRAALAASPGCAAFGSPTVSDWVFLEGIPTVKIGPGDSRRSHTPDEYIEEAELEAGVGFYRGLIKNYFELVKG